MIKSLIVVCFLLGSSYGQNKCFSQLDFNAAFNSALKKYEDIRVALFNSVDSGVCGLTKDNPIYNHFQSSALDPEVLAQTKFATVCNMALKDLRSKKKFSKTEFQNCLSNIVTSEFCTPLSIKCDFATTSYYRTDGQCNNQLDLLMGAKGTPFTRILPASFVDGIDTPDTSRLTSPKDASQVGNSNKGPIDTSVLNGIHNDFSVIFWQIMTHESMNTKRPQFTTDEKEAGFDCCSTKKPCKNLALQNPFCIPITVSKSETCYSGKVSCIHYSKPLVSFDECNINSPAAPLNAHTPYIDLELLYNDLAFEHLTENNGIFNTEDDTIMHDILVGYDDRSGQLPGLFLFLKLWAEFHNILFNNFKSQNETKGFTTDQLLFETRKATTGAYQKFMADTVNSVIPDFVDPTFSKPNCYDPKINPQVSVEYSIAMRFFHYFIRDLWNVYPEKRFSESSKISRGASLMTNLNLMDILDLWNLQRTNRCGLTHGLLDSSWNIQGLGPQNHCNFFSKKSNTFGIDLRAYDVAIGQAMGEPSYCDVLKFFGAKSCNSNNAVKKLYGNKVENVGLTMGIDVETRGSSPIPPTAAKIIMEQYQRFICGDRFWYRHPSNGLFSQRQKNIIDNFDLRILLCMTNKCGTRFQDDCYHASGNSKFFCQSSETFDMKNWFKNGTENSSP